MEELMNKLRNKMGEYDEIIDVERNKEIILNKNTFSSKLMRRLACIGAFFPPILLIGAFILFSVKSSMLLFYTSYLFSFLCGNAYFSFLSKFEKKELNKFSNAKTSREILLEKYNYELSIYKNTVMKKIISGILEKNENKKWVISASTYWKELKIPINNYSVEELYTMRSSLENEYKEVETKIEKYVTKCFLFDNFLEFVNEKERKFYEKLFTIIYSILGGVIGGFPVLFDYVLSQFGMLISPFSNTPVTLGLSHLFGMIGISMSFTAILYSTYHKEKSKVNFYVFRQINNSLGMDRMKYEQFERENFPIYEKKLEELAGKLEELGNKLLLVDYAISKKENGTIERDSSQPEYSYLFNSAKPLDMGTNCTNIKGNGLRRILERKEDE